MVQMIHKAIARFVESSERGRLQARIRLLEQQLDRIERQLEALQQRYLEERQKEQQKRMHDSLTKGDWK